MALAFTTLEMANDDHEYLKRMHDEVYVFAEQNKLVDTEKA